MEFNLLKPSTWFSAKEDNIRISNKAEIEARLTYTGQYAVPFNGEKDLGMAGPIIDYVPEHYSLVSRSWQALLESDLAIIAIGRKIQWVIGAGLKLQSEPVLDVLEAEGIKIDKQKFSKQYESRFNLLRKEKSWHYSGQLSLDQIAKIAYKNALIAGDVLVVLRVIKGSIKIQLIDGADVQSPDYGSEWWPNELPNGHLIIDGVELNEKREHIAYWVRTYALSGTAENFTQTYKFERVAAKGKKSDVLLAYLFYGDRHRIGNTRGLPLLAACHQKLNNIGQYSDATLKSAQEVAKIDYVQENDLGSSGAAGFAKDIVRSANGIGKQSGSLPVTDDGVTKANNTVISHFGKIYNLPPGGKLKVLENRNQLYMKDFFTVHSDTFFAVVNIPPNVAMGKYEDSFSASRMATGDWQNTLIIDRDVVTQDFYKPIYSLWLDLQVLQGRINAPQYLKARNSNDEALILAYRNVRMIGSNVPAVDALKEAEAARIVLGKAAEHLPLNDVQSVTEELGNGDAAENFIRFAKELQDADKLNIETPAFVQQVKNNPQPGKKSKAK